LNKELEGIKQNKFENDEVNEIKYKYQEEKRTNEELKERIMRLQNNMITSVAHTDQPSNKVIIRYFNLLNSKYLLYIILERVSAKKNLGWET